MVRKRRQTRRAAARRQPADLRALIVTSPGSPSTIREVPPMPSAGFGALRARMNGPARLSSDSSSSGTPRSSSSAACGW